MGVRFAGFTAPKREGSREVRRKVFINRQSRRKAWPERPAHPLLSGLVRLNSPLARIRPRRESQPTRNVKERSTLRLSPPHPITHPTAAIYCPALQHARAIIRYVLLSLAPRRARPRARRPPSPLASPIRRRRGASESVGCETARRARLPVSCTAVVTLANRSTSSATRPH